MPDLREVFEMTMKQMGEPDVDSWREQEKRQRTTSRNRKIGAMAVAAVLVGAAVMLGISALGSDDGQPTGSDATSTLTPNGADPTASPLPTVTDGPLEPGRYVISTTDPDFGASHRITLDVPEGYSGTGDMGVLKEGLVAGATGVVMWPVADVFVDACEWRGARSAVSSADEVVAALADQKALRPTTPTDATVAGFAATYMELTTPSLAKVSRCDDARFTLWDGSNSSPAHRYLNRPGEVQLLWILDVGGVPLVIHAPVSAESSAQDRAEVLQMVDSIRIESR